MFLIILFILNLIECKDYIDHVSCDKYIGNFILYAHTNDTIYSLNNYTKLTIQYDGNLVLKTRINKSSNNWIIKWQTGSQFNKITTDYNQYPRLEIQTAGNLVIYVNSSEQIWSSNSSFI